LTLGTLDNTASNFVPFSLSISAIITQQVLLCLAVLLYSLLAHLFPKSTYYQERNVARISQGCVF